MFYGGQLYTSPSVNPPPKRSKPNQAKTLSSLSSYEMKKKVEALKVKENLAIPKHLSEGEASAVKDIVQTNEFL